MAAAVTTDDIYKRYLDKAIREILHLEHEIADAAGGAPVAQPTGHPLGTIFLLKYGPQAPELQEGVAFHGRAGHALKRSLERLHVDAGRGVRNELRQVRGRRRGRLPRLARARAPDRAAAPRRRDGRGRARVPERASSSRSRSRSRLRWASSSSFTPTIEALVVPDIDLSLDEQPAKTRFWNAFKPVGPWWAALPPY